MAAPGTANTAGVALAVGGTLALGQAGGTAGSINAGTVALAGAGGIVEPNGGIAANLLTGGTLGASGPVALTGNNSVTVLGGLRSTGGRAGQQRRRDGERHGGRGLAGAGGLGPDPAGQRRAGGADRRRHRGAVGVRGDRRAQRHRRRRHAGAAAAADLPGRNRIATLGAVAVTGAVRVEARPIR